MTSQDTLSSPITELDLPEDIQVLRQQLERTQAAFVSVIMEKNFLQRALADLNFHHNAHDGIVFTDAQNRVVYANPYFLKMMNVADPAEFLNKPMPVYMWERPEDAERLFTDVRENGFVRERELNLYNQHKEPIFVACSSVASKDEDGNFVGTEIMLCNVTSKRKVQAELVQRKRELESLTEFCRGSLKGLVEIVQRGVSNEELLDVLRQMQETLDRSA
jgi:PAS domain-containing protein